MKISTTRFGELEVQEKDIISFPRGLIGFPETTRYVVIDHPGGGPFRWLQSLDKPETAFAITDPLLFFPDYRVPVATEDLSPIEIEDPSAGVVIVILVVPHDPWKITANLQGPVVINTEKRLGMQVILSVPEYTTKHCIFAKEGVPQGA